MFGSAICSLDFQCFDSYLLCQNIAVLFSVFCRHWCFICQPTNTPIFRMSFVYAAELTTKRKWCLKNQKHFIFYQHRREALGYYSSISYASVTIMTSSTQKWVRNKIKCAIDSCRKGGFRTVVNLFLTYIKCSDYYWKQHNIYFTLEFSFQKPSAAKEWYYLSWVSSSFPENSSRNVGGQS